MFGRHHHDKQDSADLTNPRVPLTWQIGQLTEGLSIVIDGYAPHNCERFSLNLQRGSSSNADILFHFNPRYSQKEIIRNARINGSWGPEEKHGGMGIIKNRRFQMQILVEPQHYTVQIDGRTFCHFNHRAPINLADVFTADGNLVLNKVSYRRAFNPQPTMPVYPGGLPGPTYPGPGPTYPGPGGSFPPPFPASGGFPPGPGAFPPNPPPYPGLPGTMGPILNPAVPLVTAIPGGLMVGRTIIMNCNIKSNARRFKINLQVGAQSYPPPDIALHFNPRYDDNHQVVFNTKINNAYGSEERHPMTGALRHKGTVEIRITCNPQDFHVFVNNEFFAAYTHRLPPGRIADTLDVEGDLTINSVSFY